MLKIMIVDDEAIFRERLISTVEWEYLGFTICSEARNGRDALEKVDEACPDIILADINMPVMDGLTMAEKLSESGSDISVVLITGHSEFEYARKALKTGVVDYILKPLKKEELLKTLLKIKSKKLEAIRQKKDVESSRQVLKERFLSTLISRGFYYTHEEVLSNFKSFGINAQLDFFTVSVIEIDNLYEKWDKIEDISLWKFTVYNIFQEITGRKYMYLIFDDSEGRIVVINGITGEKSEFEKMKQCYRDLCHVIERYFPFTVTVGIGDIYSDLSEIRTSYIEAVSALQNKFVEGGNRIIEYNRSDSANRSAGFYSGEINENIMVNLRLNNREGLKDQLEAVYNYITESKLSIDYTRTIYAGLVALCLSYITEMGRSIEDIFGKSFSPFSEVNRMKSLNQLHAWIENLFMTTIEYIISDKSSRSRRIAEDAVEYIMNNYMDKELSVEKVAHNVFVACSYLRYVFKKETGSTVGDYITRIRMQKAKELLSEGNRKLSDISDAIGFTDSGYFSKCFKKYYGISPSDFENASK